MERGTFATGFVAVGATIAVHAGVAVVAGRMGEAARFVTWQVLGFTVIAALTAIIGVWSGRRRPLALAAGVLLALPLSYFLTAAPMPAVAVVLVCLGGVAVTVGEGASGVAAGAGGLMVLLVILQSPAVECREAGTTSNSGPWWIESSGSSSGASHGSGEEVEGVARGSTQVGDRRYEYTCEGGRLTTFRRSAR